jgi:FkbM family methyltransferase
MSEIFMKKLRKLATTLLVRGVRALPAGAKAAIFDELAEERSAFRAAGYLARRAGITGFVAEGDAGVIRGALDDNWVLRPYAKNGFWSPHQISLFKSAFADHGGTYLDIGANIGLTVIPVAQNSQVICHAFEPEPTNFRYLCENVAVNCRAGNVKLHNLAVHDQNVSLPFEIAVGHSGDHRISMTNAKGEQGEHNRQKIIVAAKRLDEVVTDLPEPIAVKIDVQGAEPFVLSGGRNTISRAILLDLEFWPYSMRRMGADINAVISFLVDHFSEGSISVGDADNFLGGSNSTRDADKPTAWEPITSVAASLQQFATDSKREDYLDVLVRKV